MTSDAVVIEVIRHMTRIGDTLKVAAMTGIARSRGVRIPGGMAGQAL